MKKREERKKKRKQREENIEKKKGFNGFPFHLRDLPRTGIF